MSEIRKYVIVQADDTELDYEYDTFDEAQTEAVKLTEPVAIIARVYTYEDSELAWTSTGDETWPPARCDYTNCHFFADREVNGQNLCATHADEYDEFLSPE